MVVPLEGGRIRCGESGLTSGLYSNFEGSSADCSDHGVMYEGLSLKHEHRDSPA